MSDSFTDLLAMQGSGPSPNRVKETCRVFGVVAGVVTNNKDPDKLGRVKVKIGDLSDSDAEAFETTWAKMSSPMAGKERGIYFLPEVDDEVLVAFQQGDIAYPFVVGCIWNHEDVPCTSDDMCGKMGASNARGVGKLAKHQSAGNSPYSTGSMDHNSDGKNHLRFIRSRSGHLLMFDDTPDKERLMLMDKTYKHRINIRSDKKKIILANEDGDIEMYAPKGTIYMEAKEIQMISTEAFKIESKDTFDAFSKGKLKLETGATADYLSKSKMTKDTKAALERKAASSLKYEAGGSMKIEAGSAMTAKAGMIMVN